jgi:hypothetical protein
VMLRHSALCSNAEYHSAKCSNTEYHC